MIVSLEGVVESVSTDPGIVVVNVSGVGFGVFVDTHTASALHPGERVKLFVTTVFSEKGVELYGFLDSHRRDVFNTLMKISKIGPRLALRLLSHLSEEELKAAVENEDPAILQKVPGVGKKMSERLLFELKRLGDEFVVSPTVGLERDASVSQALEALMALGYSKSEAVNAVKTALKSLDAKEAEVEEIVREALKSASSR